MPEGLLKIVGFTLIVFIISEASQSKNQHLNFDLAKRSLAKRERQFFKSEPISEDLRAFIEKYKRKSKARRGKRSQNIEESMYIIQDGQLMPFKSMNGLKNDENGNRRNEMNSFTVVPLIIPLLSNQQQDSKLVKIRNLNEELQNSAAKVPPTPSEQKVGIAPLPPEEKVEVPPLPSASSLNLPSSASNSRPMTPEQTDDSNSEEDGNNNSTKEETQVLHKILEDVEGLMQWKHEGNKKEGVICSVNGSWISDAAGMRFDICYKNSTRKKFKIRTADRIPPNEDGFLCDGNWTLFGEIPFLHSGMVIALAVHAKDKHIATFIGECRVCEGSETVTGTWLVARSSRDCKDQKAAHKILSDVWKREQGHTLRKKHLQQLGYTDVKDDD